jgi:hypothetical protein
MPGVPVNLWRLPCAFYFCTRAMGAAGTRHFPAPSYSRANGSRTTRAPGAARSQSCGCGRCGCLKIESGYDANRSRATRAMSSYAGSTRVSIDLLRIGFIETGWMAGSSPAMTWRHDVARRGDAASSLYSSSGFLPPMVLSLANTASTLRSSRCFSVGSYSGSLRVVSEAGSRVAPP